MKKNDIVWYVGIRTKQDGILSTDVPFHIIPNPKNKWMADPFLLEYNGKTYLFVEMYDHMIHRGVIGVSEVSQEGISPCQEILREPYHMSYPYVWSDINGIHMCAETGSGKSLHFYKAVQFPYKWEKEKVLISDKNWADTTFLHALSGEPIGGVAYEYTDNWDAKGMVFFKIENEKIQISEDIHTIGFEYERCAGKMICNQGNLYRVAQNCGVSYGHNMAITKVDAKWPEYRETLEREIPLIDIRHDGRFKAIGTHTYNYSNQYEVVDFRCHEFHWFPFLYIQYAEFRRKLRILKKRIFNKELK